MLARCAVLLNLAPSSHRSNWSYHLTDIQDLAPLSVHCSGLDRPLTFLSFQSLPTVNFSNSFVLTFIHQCRGGIPPSGPTGQTIQARASDEEYESCRPVPAGERAPQVVIEGPLYLITFFFSSFLPFFLSSPIDTAIRFGYQLLYAYGQSVSPSRFPVRARQVPLGENHVESCPRSP